MDTEHRYKGTLQTRKGDFTFEYFLTYSDHYKSNIFCFDVWDENDTRIKPRKFSFILQEMKSGTDLKVVDLFASDYQGKGISIAIILKAKSLFGKRIISSSSTRPDTLGEQNWPEAIEKVWKPMVAQGLAMYDEANDHYIVM